MDFRKRGAEALLDLVFCGVVMQFSLVHEDLSPHHELSLVEVKMLPVDHRHQERDTGRIPPFVQNVPVAGTAATQPEVYSPSAQTRERVSRAEGTPPSVIAVPLGSATLQGADLAAADLNGAILLQARLSAALHSDREYPCRGGSQIHSYTSRGFITAR